MNVFEAIVKGIVEGLQQVALLIVQRFGDVVDPREQDWTYVADIADETTTLADGATFSHTLSTLNSHDFVLCKRIAYSIDSDGNAETRWTAKIKIAGTASEELSDQQVYALNLFGTAQLPALLSKPLWIRRGANIKIEGTNLTNDTIYVLQICLEGYRIENPEYLRAYMRS